MRCAHIKFNGNDIIAYGFIFTEVYKYQLSEYMFDIVVNGTVYESQRYTDSETAEKDRTQLITNVLCQLRGNYAKTSPSNTEAFGVVTESEPRSDESLKCSE